jgi:hypothetical protein
MIELDNGKPQICRKKEYISRALKQFIYIQDPDGREDPVSREFVQDFISRIVGRFLLEFHDGYTVNDNDRFDNFAIGSVATYEVDNDLASVLHGYGILLSSTLLTIYLHHNLPEAALLESIMGDIGRQRYMDDEELCVQETYRALIDGQTEDKGIFPESCHHIFDRYKDVAHCFPTVFDQKTLTLFAHWFLNKVKVEEVTAVSKWGKRMLASVVDKGWPIGH